tara:strand:- start:4050 stop:4502 length:453 start_codon:yes stop_codon:yes gene_type:complete
MDKQDDIQNASGHSHSRAATGSLSTDINLDRQWILGARYALNCMEADSRQLVDDAIAHREQLIVDAKRERTQRMNMPDPKPQTNTTAPEQALSQSDLLEDLLRCMVDMHDNATDTYWVNAGETLWERMASIYEKNGGDMEEIKAKFPQYF